MNKSSRTRKNSDDLAWGQKFSIVNKVVSAVEATKIKQKGEDRERWENAITEGKKLFSILEGEGVDRRLLDITREIINSLNNNVNVIKVGILQITLNELGGALIKELSSPTYITVQKFSEVISEGLDCTKEWPDFKQVAFIADTKLPDVETISNETADELEKHPIEVEARVPEILEESAQSAHGDTSAGKIRKLNLLYTLRNLFVTMENGARSREIPLSLFTASVNTAKEAVDGAIKAIDKLRSDYDNRPSGPKSG